MKNIMIKTTIVLLGLYIVLLFSDNVYADILELDVGEKYDIKTHVIDCDENVSFYSLDSSIVSVDSNGYVTGVKPGNTSVKISYVDINGEIKEYYVGFNVILQTGYYRIRNIETNKYLSVRNINLKYDSSVFLTDYYLSGNEQLCQIWQVIRISSDNKYLIKPYSNELAILSHNLDFDDIRIERLSQYDEDYNEVF